MAETVANLTRRRGDTYPIDLSVVDTEGSPVDITGATFKLTVSSEEAPTDTTGQLFQVAGSIVNAAAGTVTFAPSASNTDAVGTYYYDIEMTDDAGVITTLVTGEFILLQDITKPA